MAVSAMVAALLCSGAPGAMAQEKDSSVVVVIAPFPAGAVSFAAALDTAIARELADEGFGPFSRFEAGAGDTATNAEFAAAASSATKARWAAVLRCSLDNRRVFWSIAVFDGLDGALVASDARAAFAGLSALSSIDGSAVVVASATAALRGRTLPGEAIRYRIRFESADEGASVAFGSGPSSRPLGLVIDGALAAPYAAFESGTAIVATVAKEGYWPRSVSFRPGIEDEPVELPPLMLRARHALSAGTSAGRFLGLSADYRFFVAPDSVFIRAGTQAWLQGAEGSDVAIIHDELRLGLGAYLFLPRPSRFRVAAGTGISGIVSLTRSAAETTDSYFDLSFDAIWVSYEWHMPRLAFFVEHRAAYSFGIEDGLLRRGWWEAGDMPMLFSAGAMLKW